ncbi:hypothetical protein U14_04411 [Candidatus Moduliflexus flocculans]|uniref:Uncharacterized protein n=1 Tax=Candidatus Moduliflexus flocculans TaxID=1499966 RepID=A0A0S6W407_9BACT|nr:hypothetical protein U14_04411 [Candidatus Moduliflexus flocculans]
MTNDLLQEKWRTQERMAQAAENSIKELMLRSRFNANGRTLPSWEGLGMGLPRRGIVP